MRRLVPLLALVLMVGTCRDLRAERVAHVIDGDTIELASGVRVRYIGVDTPEIHHPRKPVQYYGREAAEFHRRLVEGMDVRLEYDVERKDRYGRTLAYVYLDTLFVNAELVRQGYAQILTIPPNVKYASLFLSLQRRARANRQGLWDERAESAWRAGGGAGVVAPERTVYVAKTGKKYHRPDCRRLARGARATTLSAALARGLTPCSACKPPGKPSR
jgi:micrococcal nuclease